MVARYTIFLEQISPQISDGVTVAFDQIPTGFSYIANTTFSADGSMTSIEPTNVGSTQDPILMWDFDTGLGGPVLLAHGQIKEFSFDVNINRSENRYCNSIYLKPNRETTGMVSVVQMGDPSQDDGCQNGGVITSKYINTPVVIANQPTTVTYVINVENFDTSTLAIDSVRDMLPQGGITYVADSATYILAEEPFDPLEDSFTDVSGHYGLPDTELQQSTLASGREQLIWILPHGGASPNWSLAQADNDDSILIIRFQAQATLTGSGTYFNELFADVGSGCSAPQALVSVGCSPLAKRLRSTVHATHGPRLASSCQATMCDPYQAA